MRDVCGDIRWNLQININSLLRLVHLSEEIVTIAM